MNEAKYYVFKIVTGEDIICTLPPELQTADDSFCMKDPFVVVLNQDMSGKINIGMLPFCMYKDGDTVLVPKDRVVLVVKPQQKLIDSYQSITSRIALPQKSIVV